MIRLPQDSLNASPFRIYVENKAGQADAYSVTKERIQAALQAEDRATQIDICDSAEPELDNLLKATHFVGYGFDPERIRHFAPNLSVVHCTSAGVERYMPLDWLPPGAVLTNSSGVHAEKGGAFGAMALLMLNEFIPSHATSQRLRRWDRVRSTSIAGKTVVIFGLGALGAAIAQKIRVFDVKVIGVRRSGNSHPDADIVCGPQDLHELLPQADFLVLACPLTPETRGLIGQNELALLPRGAGVLNIARGPVLDNEALTSALIANHLSGAILDVFDPEPLPKTSPLWDVPNLLVTPHTSCDDARGNLDQCLAIFGENLARQRGGRPLLNVVDGQRGY